MNNPSRATHWGGDGDCPVFVCCTLVLSAATQMMVYSGPLMFWEDIIIVPVQKTSDLLMLQKDRDERFENQTVLIKHSDYKSSGLHVHMYMYNHTSLQGKTLLFPSKHVEHLEQMTLGVNLKLRTLMYCKNEFHLTNLN